MMSSQFFSPKKKTPSISTTQPSTLTSLTLVVVNIFLYLLKCVLCKKQYDLKIVVYISILTLFFKPVITAQEKEKELPKLSTGNKTNLINCLDGFIDKEAKPKAYGLALSLLSEPEPEQALNRWLEEQTNV